MTPRLAAPRTLLSVAICAALAACQGASSGDSADDPMVELARGIHERVITLDTHDDINAGNFTAEQNYTMDLSTQVTLPKMEAGGLDVAWFIVYVGQGELTPAAYERAHAAAIEKFDAIHRLTEEIAPDRIGLALTSDDVRRIAASGRKVAMIGIENAYQVGTDLDNIRDFHERGGRYMSLAHNGHSQFADSNTGERDGDWLHGGLSDLGRQAVAEMNRWGIMIDVSHPSKEANLQAMELTRAPVIASHSAARALGDHSRNLDDEQLQRLAEIGGVVQTVAFRSYLRPDKNRAYQDALSALRGEIAEDMGFELRGRGGRGGLRGPGPAERDAYLQQLAELDRRAAPRIEAEVLSQAPPVDVSDLVDHVDYLVNLIGIEHVGISSDFDGGGGVHGWADASETFNVTLELVRRGYTEDEIAMIWSGNLLRVLDEVQAVAADIQAGG